MVSSITTDAPGVCNGNNSILELDAWELGFFSSFKREDREMLCAFPFSRKGGALMTVIHICTILYN
jgi:hypothetical protein